MGLITLILLSVSLAMDAFAVSVGKGLAMSKISFGNMLTVGLWFGGFQGIMPLIGYYLGTTFTSYIEAVDHWVAFGLLLIIGVNMIRESFSKDEDEASAALDFKTMLIMAIATSIDALAVGVSFACVEQDGSAIFGGIFTAVALIAVITCVISMTGVKIGSIFGTKYKARAEFAGGAVLIAIGLKFVLEAYI